MAREVELKFEVPTGMLRVLSGRLGRLTREPVKRDKLVSVYFDTAKRTLRDNGLSLRVRRVDGHYTQTIKDSGIQRQEWEEDVTGAEPDRGMARHTTLAPFATKKKWRKLQAVFETVVDRASFPVRCGDSLIEVAVDHGKLKAGHDSRTISEIELELKKGKIADLARLAGRIAVSKRVSFGLRSKAERGYALADEEINDHVGAFPIALDTDSCAADGFRVIGFSCLHHLAANRQAVLNDDPEGVHQMRVGLRRLRAALSLFKPMLEGGGFEKVKKDLKWMSGELAAARDFDVFVAKTIKPMEQDAPSGLKALKSDLDKRRHQGFIRAKRMVKGERYRRIVLNTGLWLTGGDWAVSSDDMRRNLRERGLQDTANTILSERTKKVLKKLKKLEKLDAMGRHKLRIAVKKLRYAVSFFTSLSRQDKAQRRFAGRLKKLQDALGRLNDVQVHRTFARDLIKGKSQLPRGAYALGVVTGVERGAVEPCLAEAAKAGAKLRRLPVFWN
ncbi:MAG TPA: CHAD domain-containing protein [Rhizomicrobium sp.]|nr:CHAD domain-containing protein [Rhizomicrobium sp.]